MSRKIQLCTSLQKSSLSKRSTMHVCVLKAFCVTIIPHSHLTIESAWYCDSVMPCESRRLSNSDTVRRLAEWVCGQAGTWTTGILSESTSVAYIFSRYLRKAITTNKLTKHCKWLFKWPRWAWSWPPQQNIFWRVSNERRHLFTELCSKTWEMSSLNTLPTNILPLRS
jgi:hypothetical protein